MTTKTKTLKWSAFAALAGGIALFACSSCTIAFIVASIMGVGVLGASFLSGNAAYIAIASLLFIGSGGYMIYKRKNKQTNSKQSCAC